MAGIADFARPADHSPALPFRRATSIPSAVMALGRWIALMLIVALEQAKTAVARRVSRLGLVGRRFLRGVYNERLDRTFYSLQFQPHLL